MLLVIELFISLFYVDVLQQVNVTEYFLNLYNISFMLFEMYLFASKN